MRVEEVEGLPFLEIRIDKSAIARRGLSLTPLTLLVLPALYARFGRGTETMRMDEASAATLRGAEQ